MDFLVADVGIISFYLLVEADVHECICGCYYKYCNEMCYKAIVRKFCFVFNRGHCKYFNALSYKSHG